MAKIVSEEPLTEMYPSGAERGLGRTPSLPAEEGFGAEAGWWTTYSRGVKGDEKEWFRARVDELMLERGLPLRPPAPEVRIGRNIPLSWHEQVNEITFQVKGELNRRRAGYVNSTDTMTTQRVYCVQCRKEIQPGEVATAGTHVNEVICEACSPSGGYVRRAVGRQPRKKR